MRKILLIPFAALLLSCEYDCSEEYNRWQVVEIYHEKVTIKKGCNYKEVFLPKYFTEKYDLGDTIGRLTADEKNDMDYNSWRSQILKEYSENVKTNLTACEKEALKK